MKKAGPYIFILVLLVAAIAIKKWKETKTPEPAPNPSPADRLPPIAADQAEEDGPAVADPAN